MKCPNDGSTLVMSERRNVEIDYCPECRGIWLDRGELDKIISQVEAASASAQLTTPAQSPQQPQSQPQSYQQRQPTYDDRGYTKPRKKQSPFELLGDIFG
ncbi:zf-TFIIB domain-containing protein [Leucobacter sp. cx-328]|nr:MULTISPECIES: zf-TFIIB domain-containing protein [unclassified Leucobacter]MBC9944199.1 zf-TFIIB domain-containing protein [Leucobacter sp. cx-328]